MANQYITTDESLEKFQAKFNSKNIQKDQLQLRNDPQQIKSAEGCQPFNQVKTHKDSTTKKQKKASVPKNIKTALEYYNLMES
jgi:hypothetical protein